MQGRIVLLLLGLWLVSRTVFAGGFAIPPQGTRATGLGLAFCAVADDVTAVWHNPAGLAEQRGDKTYLAAHVGKATVNYTMPGEEKVGLKRDIFYYPFVGFSTDFGSDRLGAGIGLYSPYGAIVAFPNDGPQRHILQSEELKTYFVTSALGYKITDKLSLGAGFTYIYASVYMNQEYNLSGFPSPIPLKLDTTDPASFAANFGLLYHATSKLHFGLSYFSRVTTDLTGTVQVAKIPRKDDLRVSSLKVNLPDIARAGLKYDLSDQWFVTGEFYFWHWSVLKEFEVNLTVPQGYPFQVPNPYVFPKEFKDSYSIALGAQYKLSTRSRLLGGFFYDTTPIPDKTNDIAIPDSTKFGLTGGYMYESGSLRSSLIVANGFYDDRHITDSMQNPTTNGDYQYNFFFVLADISYTF